MKVRVKGSFVKAVNEYGIHKYNCKIEKIRPFVGYKYIFKGIITDMNEVNLIDFPLQSGLETFNVDNLPSGNDSFRNGFQHT